jgi:PEP-CTERM motif
MKLQKSLIAAALTVLAFQVNAAAPTFASMAAVAGSYAAPVFTTITPADAYVANNSVNFVRLAPLFDTGTFLVVNPAGSAEINLGGAKSFSFLWGSPDQSNTINIDGFTFTGGSLLGSLANSSNANTQWATFTSDVGMTSFKMTTNQVAFEMAVANPVPEPETYALMLGGLGALAFVARRRKA